MKVEIYKDKKKLWRWRAKSSNGRIIADSDQGYTQKHNLINALDILKYSLISAKFVCEGKTIYV
tara:strand:- start:453 stop:644 length:192 start_codon:yes stop_codon:yes gene_type:complete